MGTFCTFLGSISYQNGVGVENYRYEFRIDLKVKKRGFCRLYRTLHKGRIVYILKVAAVLLKGCSTSTHTILTKSSTEVKKYSKPIAFRMYKSG